MPKEQWNPASPAPKPDEKPEVKQSQFEVFRRKMVKALLLGSSLVLFEACGPTDAEIAQMPTTKVESILKNPTIYTKRNYVKIEGHIADLGEKQTSTSEHYTDINKKDRIKTTYTITHYYNLYDKADRKSPRIEMNISEDFPESRTNGGAARPSLWRIQRDSAAKGISLDSNYEVLATVVHQNTLNKGMQYILKLVKLRNTDTEDPFTVKNVRK